MYGRVYLNSVIIRFRGLVTCGDASINLGKFGVRSHVRSVPSVRAVRSYDLRCHPVRRAWDEIQPERDPITRVKFLASRGTRYTVGNASAGRPYGFATMLPPPPRPDRPGYPIFQSHL